MEILQQAGSLGVGAFLGALIFIMYSREKRSGEKRLTKLLEEDQDSRRENTKVLTQLVTLIERLNGKLR